MYNLSSLLGPGPLFGRGFFTSNPRPNKGPGPSKLDKLYMYTFSKLQHTCTHVEKWSLDIKYMRQIWMVVDI